MYTVSNGDSAGYLEWPETTPLSIYCISFHIFMTNGGWDLTFGTFIYRVGQKSGATTLEGHHILLTCWKYLANFWFLAHFNAILFWTHLFIHSRFVIVTYNKLNNCNELSFPRCHHFNEVNGHVQNNTLWNYANWCRNFIKVGIRLKWPRSPRLTLPVKNRVVEFIARWRTYFTN